LRDDVQGRFAERTCQSAAQYGLRYCAYAPE
jgi:hypothetical protein